MASPKLLFLLSVLLIFTFATFTSADPVPSEDSFLHVQNDAVDQSEGAEFELRKLKSRISYLETSIEDRTSELNKKDGGIKKLEKVIEDKSNNLALLQKEVGALQEKSSSKLKEQVGEIDARVIELEKQVVHLTKEIELQNKRKEDFKARSKAAEEKIERLNSKLENLRKINDDQKSRIHDMHHALQVAEEEMLKAKLESSSQTKKLKKVHKAWLPHWASAHLVHIEAFVLNYWNENGLPVFDQTIKKALKKKYEVEKWAKPYFETMISKWSSTIKEQYNTVVNVLNPLVQSLWTQAIDYYHLVWSTIEPHIVNIQLTMDPYFQEVKMVMKPHIDRALETAKPHLNRARLFSKPFSKKVAHYHKKITKKIRVYHSWKWSSTIKEQYNTVVNVLNPLVQSLSTQAIDYYHLVWSTIEPHIVNIQLTMDPYFQEVKMVMKPHIDRALETAKPHLNRARLFSKPFSKKVAHYHKKITKKFRVYHSWVQATLHKTLNRHKLTKPLATKWLVRFMASILMALPLILLVRTLVPKGSKKQLHCQSRSHTRRRPKRIHPDK